jgi:two-component system, sensor histidine kinase LadS
MKRHPILLILLLCATAGFGQRAVITDDIDEHVFMPYDLTYLIDSTNNLSIREVSSERLASSFVNHGAYQNKDFRTNTSYWIRISIAMDPASRKMWLLEFYDQTIDRIDAYIPSAGDYQVVQLGDAMPFVDRPFRHKNFELPIEKANANGYYYFRVQSHEFADLRIAVRSVNRFIFYSLNEYFLFGTFYGMIIIISLYNFLIFLAIREVKNIYYIIYILSVAAYAMSLDGIGFQYLWPNHPEWNDYAAGIALYSLIVWALVFTRRFLNTAATAPMLDRALMAMIAARSIMFLIELFFFPNLLIYRNHDIIPLSLIFYTAIQVWLNGYRPARFFVIAYGLLFTGFFLRTLVHFNVLPFTTISHYSLHFSFVLEMLFLTMALGDRVRILKDNRDRAMRRIIDQHELNMRLQGKVNRELEQKVLERTLAIDHKNRELQESNSSLVRQAREISQINSMLDLDNWKLTNKIKAVLQERLHDTTMSYDEFITLYPDKLACFRFLEDLKWKATGFHCRKCANTRYFPGAQKFSRRCSRCGYNESITAFTIFHGIKFPIEKAFFIAYLTVSGKRGLTLEKIGEQLSLAVNTVWAFRTKVQHRVEELSGEGGQPTFASWEEVILMEETPRNLEARLNHKKAVSFQ